MTDQEVEQTYEQMEKLYGKELPNPFQEPLRFAWYVKMFKYNEQKKTESTDE